MAIIPIYWELIEPQPGRFDFALVDQVIAAARRHGLRLTLQWFATWKNGEMNYTPEWVKRDRARFKRAIGMRGEELNIISPLSPAARDADARAFAAVMKHLRQVDEAQRTVIMVQVENEPGLLGSDRDYSAEATRLFNAAVPAELMAYLKKNRGRLSADMREQLAAAHVGRTGAASGARAPRLAPAAKSPRDAAPTWGEVFGTMAPEAFSGWHIARYVDFVAAAGKRAYPLPLYTNAWLVEPLFERAGRWPSGGPTRHVIDIWKAAALHLDLIAPDIYFPKFYDSAADYARPDNPLFIPEVNYQPFFGALPFMAFCEFNAICFSPFGIDSAIENGALNPIAAEFEDSYRVLRPLLPTIARYQYTGKLHSLIQGVCSGENWALDVHLDDESVAAMVEFTIVFNPERGRAAGLILELAPRDYIVAGRGFKITFRELEGPLRDCKLLSVEEGTFEGDRWTPTKRLHGDELRVALPRESKILRVRLAPG
jgi:hypothetical protein